MKGYAVLSFLGFTCSVMSACIASTEPPDGAGFEGARTDRMGSAAQRLEGCPIDGTSPCDSDGDPDTDQDPPPQPRCPVKWYCNGGLEAYNSFSSCNAECTGTCGQDFACDHTCYCP